MNAHILGRQVAETRNALFVNGLDEHLVKVAAREEISHDFCVNLYGEFACNDNRLPLSCLRAGDDDESIYVKSTLKSSASKVSRTSCLQTPWHQKREWPKKDADARGLSPKQRKITKALTAGQRDEIERAWTAAGERGMALDAFLTAKPDISHISPAERQFYWDEIVHKLRSYIDRRGIPFAFVATRESHPDRHDGEHIHILTHIGNKPLSFKACRRHCMPDGATEFDLLAKVAEGWCPNMQVDRATDCVRFTDDGRIKSAFSYITKATPQAGTHAVYRRSGAIVGPRFKISRSLNAKSRSNVADGVETKIAARRRLAGEHQRIATRKAKNARNDTASSIVDHYQS